MVSWKGWYFSAADWPLRFLASLCVGSIPLQSQILITVLLRSACRCDALRAVQGRGWYTAQSVCDLWDLLEVQGTVLIVQNGLETDLHLTERSNVLLSVYSQWSIWIMQLCSKTVNFYLPLHSIVILSYLWKGTNWCLYLAQNHRSHFNVSLSEAVDFIFSHCMVLVHRYYFFGHAATVSK